MAWEEELNLDFQKAYEVFKETMREGDYILAVKSALEKQIPKKPCIPFDSIYQEYECPVCPHKVDKTQLYCGKCGQALDWGGSE